MQRWTSGRTAARGPASAVRHVKLYKKSLIHVQAGQQLLECLGTVSACARRVSLSQEDPALLSDDMSMLAGACT